MTVPLVIDASIAASWCFPDENSTLSRAALDHGGRHGMLAPAIWWYEIRNVLIVAERRKRITQTDSAVFLSELARLPLRIVPPADEHLTLTLARSHNLTVYDAAYLALALQEDAKLATLDKALAAAAKKAGAKTL